MLPPASTGRCRERLFDFVRFSPVDRGSRGFAEACCTGFLNCCLTMRQTGSGQTAVVMALVERLPVELISVDSAQAFIDMDGGTAKPDRVIPARCPQGLINLMSPEESYSAARFRTDAPVAMAESTAASEVPVLVGGMLLHFRALVGRSSGE